MGLRPCDFEMMTPVEFYYAFVGFAARERMRMQEAWERTRWETWVLTSIQLEKKDRRPIMEMFPLPWDNDKESLPAAPQREMTIEERQQRVQQIMKECTPPSQ